MVFTAWLPDSVAAVTSAGVPAGAATGAISLLLDWMPLSSVFALLSLATSCCTACCCCAYSVPIAAACCCWRATN